MTASSQPRRRSRAAAVVLLACSFVACAGPTPRDAIAEYRDAVRARDPARIRALSDASFRASYSEEDLRAALDAEPKALERAIERLDAASGAAGERAELVLANGDRIVLALEDGVWRIASGGVELARFDTPEHALSAFLEAVDGKRWSVVRRAIPQRHSSAFATDEALAAHVAEMKPRIDRAKKAIAAMPAVHAVVEGAKAELTYGEAKRVTFEREDGAWRIVDLE